jgi:hypothetical protein
MTCIPNEFIVKTKKYVKNRFGNVKLCEQLIHIIKRLQIGSKSNQISERLPVGRGMMKPPQRGHWCRESP